MSLIDYLETLKGVGEVESFASRCLTSVGYLNHVAKGRRQPSADLAIRIERESSGAVTCESLCPDTDWDYIRRSHPDSAA